MFTFASTYISHLLDGELTVQQTAYLRLSVDESYSMSEARDLHQAAPVAMSTRLFGLVEVGTANGDTEARWFPVERI